MVSKYVHPHIEILPNARLMLYEALFDFQTAQQINSGPSARTIFRESAGLAGAQSDDVQCSVHVMLRGRLSLPRQAQAKGNVYWS